MRIKPNYFRNATVLTVLLMLFYSNIHGQKLSGVQKASLWIPENINIDGKATEWNNQFQAFNKATEISYTVANNDQNLYLAIQSANPSITSKILRGGITLAINGNDERKLNGSASLTYPIVKREDMRYIEQEMYHAKSQNNEVVTSNGITGTITKDEFMRRQDSLMAAVNRKLIFVIKEIEVAGLKGIPDTLISIYNENSIKAAIYLDGKNVMTYELEVPLALLNLKADRGEISFNIKLNGPRTNAINIPGAIPGVGEGEQVAVFKDVGQVSQENMTPGMLSMVHMSSTTDFWAKYVLKKNNNNR